MVINSYYPFVANLNQDTQSIVSLAAVGNSLKLYKIFPTRKLNSRHSNSQQKNKQCKYMVSPNPQPLKELLYYTAKQRCAESEFFHSYSAPVF